jgi:hypothetical protein
LIFEWAVDVILIFDMIITFHVAYLNEYNELVDNYKDICCNYLKGWFIIDFLSLVPLDSLFFIINYLNVYDLKYNYDYNKFLKILRIGKLVKITKFA